MRRFLPSVFFNRTSIFGMTIFAISLGMIVFLAILDAFAPNKSAYSGLITFVAMPAFMLFGLSIALFGLSRAIKRKKRGEEEKKFPVVDLNDRRQFNAFNMFLTLGVFLMFASAFGSYQAYEYTESVEFCGKVCHDVMKPEFVAHQNSAHASVPCVDCHVGSGAENYVESKINGTRQLYSVLFNKYSKPIETPVRTMGDANEICGACHWQEQYHSQKLADRTYFMQDEQNSPVEISMLMKVGGSEYGKSEGIHAHMYLDSEISYVATDPHRQTIPYVEMKGKDGKVTKYFDSEAKFSEADAAKGERRKVDCMDCHNRPAHRYVNPEVSVDRAMTAGAIDRTIPEIKMIAVQQLEGEYKTEAEALSKIKSETTKYYAENYKDDLATITPKLEKTISIIQGIYKTTYFPEMKVSWKKYPDNLDHMRNLGCFRCHNDRLKSADGKVIKKDCNSCHTIISQSNPDTPRETNIKGLQFKHPMDVGDEWKTTPCKDCHGAQEEAKE